MFYYGHLARQSQPRATAHQPPLRDQRRASTRGQQTARRRSRRRDQPSTIRITTKTRQRRQDGVGRIHPMSAESTSELSISHAYGTRRGREQQPIENTARARAYDPAAALREHAGQVRAAARALSRLVGDGSPAVSVLSLAQTQRHGGSRISGKCITT